MFERPKRLELPDPKISASVKQIGDGKALVTLKAGRCALWAWLELEGMDADLSDNFFHLRPGQPQSVIVTPWQPAAAKKIAQALKVRSLVNTYGSSRG